MQFINVIVYIVVSHPTIDIGLRSYFLGNELKRKLTN